MKNILFILIVAILAGCSKNDGSPPPMENNNDNNDNSVQVEIVSDYVELETNSQFKMETTHQFTEIGILCNDGSRSDSQNRSGTCSWHDGVYDWNYPFTITKVIESWTYTVAARKIYNPHIDVECFVVHKDSANDMENEAMLLSQVEGEPPMRCGDFLAAGWTIQSQWAELSDGIFGWITTNIFGWKDDINENVNFVTYATTSEIVYLDGTQVFHSGIEQLLLSKIVY